MTRKKRSITSAAAAQPPSSNASVSAEEAALLQELPSVLSLVKEKTGHDFTSYKTATVMRRLQRRLSLLGSAGISEYLPLLSSDGPEAHSLSQDILIGVTSFFRDPDAFEEVRRAVIPRLFEKRAADQPVRIWHPCCSTGEEVYSMAILIMEHLAETGTQEKVQLFATDLDEAAIDHARSGLYPESIVEEVGEERLAAFFSRCSDGYKVTKEVREMVVFAQHSLVKDPPFSRLDLLVCRNFLIYLKPEMQKRLAYVFHQALKPGGFLFLGAAETVGSGKGLFAPLNKKWKIYSRCEGKTPADSRFPMTTVSVPPVRLPGRAGINRGAEPTPAALAERVLLERYSPPCLVVNERYRVVHVSSRANLFLEVPAGEPSTDLLKMAREEVRPTLRAAVYKALADDCQVTFRGVKVFCAGKEMLVNVNAEPLPPSNAEERLVLVTFETAPVQAVAVPAHFEEDFEDDSSRDMLVRQLEAQLRATHEQLQVATEQLESSHEGLISTNEELMSINEEFQSANEELHSTNEELETSKEELQALNEELVTVNSELHAKVEESNRLTADLENLLTSSRIATLFLDRDLKIKRYTPTMAPILNLIPSDLGLPLKRLARSLDWAELPGDAEEVLRSLTPREREVHADGRHYLMRVLPYLTVEGRVDGTVVTLVDITERKGMEDALRVSDERQRLFIEFAPAALAMFDREMRYLFVSRRWCLDYGFGERDVRGISHYELFPEISEEWKEAHRRGLAGEVLRSEADRFERADGSAQWMRWELRPWYDAAGEVGGIVIFAEDLSDLKQSEVALRQAKEEWERTFNSVPDLIAIMDDQHRIVQVNRAMAERLGVSPQECLGEKCYHAVHGSDTPPPFCPHVMTIADRQEHVAEVLEEGLGGFFLVTTTPLCSEAGELTGTVHVARDITDRKVAEEALQRSKGEVEQHLAQLQAILDHLTDGVVISDLTGELFLWNPAAVAMHGFSSPDEGRRKLPEFTDIFELITEEEGILPLERWPLARILDGEVLRDWEVTVRRRDFEWQRVFSYGGRLARDKEGKPLLAVVSLADVTERKRQAEAQALLAAIVESTDDAVILKDLGGTIRTWNAGAERIFGYCAEEVLGQPVALLIPLELQQEEDEIIRTLARGQRVDHYETVRVTRDGRRLDVSVAVSPVRDQGGRVIGASKIVRDITRRKEAEAALTESEALFHTMADAIPQLAWMANADGWIFWYNRRWYEYTGTTPEEMEGWGWRSVHDPSTLPEVEISWKASLATGVPFDMVFPLKGADGVFRPFLTRVLPVRGEDGAVVGWFGTNTDITEQRSAQSALAQSNARLTLLAETAADLLATDSPQEVVNSVCHKVLSFLDCQVFFNFLVDDEAERLRLNACAGIPEEEERQIEWLDYGVAVCGCAAKEACRMVMEEIAGSEDPRVQLVRSYGVRAYACHPLLAQGRVLGTLSFGTRTRDHFSESELALMKAVSDQVALAMERRRMEETLRRAHAHLEQRVRARTEELATAVETLLGEIAERERVEESLRRLNRLYAVFSEIDQAIVRATDRASLFQDFCRIAVEQGGFLLAWVGLSTDDGEVSVAAAWGDSAYLDDVHISVKADEEFGEGPTGISIREGTYCICNDFQNDPRTAPWHQKGRVHGIGSSASIALREDDRVVGALTLYSGEKDFFDEQHVTLIRQMGGDISFALDNLLREARRREAERALHKEALERLRATEELREKERLLIQQSRHAALGEMLGNIAHQWRQPLNALGLMIQDLAPCYQSGEMTIGYLEGVVTKVMRIIFHMSQTIDDFRNFFRPDKEKVRFRARQAVDKVLSIIDGSLKENRIAIDIQSVGDPHIDGYPNEYSQVLLNILLNARDVFAERVVPQPLIRVRLAEEDGRSVVTIDDNGGGIALEIMDKIFDPYFTTKGPDKGTGVGLYMSKAIIEKNMKGRVTARNNEAGAEFRIEV